MNESAAWNALHAGCHRWRSIDHGWPEAGDAALEIVMHPLLKRISIDPNICFGKPCVRGTRIWVSLLLDRLADGEGEADLLADYPALTPDDIRAALAYGAESARERIVSVPLEKAA